MRKEIKLIIGLIIGGIIISIASFILYYVAKTSGGILYTILAADLLFTAIALFIINRLCEKNKMKSIINTLLVMLIFMSLGVCLGTYFLKEDTISNLLNIFYIVVFLSPTIIIIGPILLLVFGIIGA